MVNMPQPLTAVPPRGITTPAASGCSSWAQPSLKPCLPGAGGKGKIPNLSRSLNVPAVPISSMIKQHNLNMDTHNTSEVKMHVILVANEDRNRMWKMRQIWTKWLKTTWDWHLLNYFLSNTEFLSISIPFSFGKEILIRAINPLFQCEIASTNKQSISAAGNTGMALNRGFLLV